MFVETKREGEIERKSVQSPVNKILLYAQRLIERKELWCQRYSDGDAICAIHALQRAYLHLNYDPHYEQASYTALGKAIGGLKDPTNGPEIGHWNDTHSHAEVMAAFDRAIAATAR